MRFYCVQLAVSVNASLLYVAGSECDNVFTLWGDGGAGHWLVRMEWRPAGWSVCLPLLIFPCTMKSRSSLLAPAHPDVPRKRAIKQLWCGGGGVSVDVSLLCAAGSECGCIFRAYSECDSVFTVCSQQ